MRICVEASYADHRYLKVYIHLTVLILVGCLVEGRPKTLENCGKRSAPMNKIVGGKEAMPGEYPWMVSLQFKERRKFEHICGASIINERYILTAAHCIYYADSPSKYEVIVGLQRMSEKSEPPAITYKISKIIMHEDYDGLEFANDIALLRTEEPIQFEETGGYVNGICLPTSEADPEGLAIVTGWGHIKDGGPSSDDLKAATVPIVPRDSCSPVYEEEVDLMIHDYQICAGTKDDDSCQNDSGGPLIQGNEEGAYTQIGIVSFGSGCGTNDFPGVYTKVASYMDWMDEHMIE